MRQIFKNVQFSQPLQKFVLMFSFDQKLVEAVKKEFDFKERFYDIQKKEWRINKECAEKLYNWCIQNDFNIALSAAQYFKQFDKQVANYELPEMPGLKISIPLKITPRPYQTTGIAYCIEKKNLLCGDDMGLGKTMQALAATLGDKKLPCLIICPAGLKNNWLNEIEKFTDKKAYIIDEKFMKNYATYLSSGYIDYAIINYDSLRKYFAKADITNSNGKIIGFELNNLASYFKALIIDEIHECCNESAQRYILTELISAHKNIEMRIGLSGTPIKNMIFDIKAQLKLVNALSYFGGEKGFYGRYGKIRREDIHHPDNQALLKELNYILKANCYYRRLKHEVATDLPDKSRQVLLVDITNRKEYDEAERDFITWLKNKGASEAKIDKAKSAEMLVQMQHLMYLSAVGKMKAFKEFVHSVNDQDHKIVIFRHNKDIGEELENHFKSFVALGGGIDSAEKDKRKKKFMEDPNCMGIICSLKADATGHTLTAADVLALLQLPWTSDRVAQAEDRIHRIGQDKNVNIYYFLGANTIDEKMYRIINSKKDLSHAVTGTVDHIKTDVARENDVFWALANEYMKAS